MIAGGWVLYACEKSGADEVKTSSKEAEQQAPAKQEAKQTQPTNKHHQLVHNQHKHHRKQHTQISAPQAKFQPAQIPAPQAINQDTPRRNPTTGDG